MPGSDTSTVVPPAAAPAPGRARRQWAIAHRPDALGPVRQQARASLAAWGVEQAAAEAVVLVVSELVTNAVCHALPPVGLRLRHDRADRRLWVEVSDGGPAAGGAAGALPPDEHGRGLLLVAAVALEHGARPHRGTAVVRWACLAAD
ncbi:ATP-binding protein [Kitasatospora sp. NA04385]|uniref:ATP-binding protein n=1 Tax=Kitasatospora sp. NA04385 TaxID=2742135 RepID=UPI0020CB124E|nr:ATP-binding protein [Kitasatospora sp. NA04385]